MTEQECPPESVVILERATLAGHPLIRFSSVAPVNRFQRPYLFTALD